MKNGPYAKAARELSARGLAVIPVRLEVGSDGKNVKKPMTRWISKPLSMKWGARGIRKLTDTFGDENIGILCKPSNVTIVDIDDTKLIDDMRKRFGDTPLQTESPSGGVHLWYRANGEACRNLRASEEIAVDIKAGGSSKGGLIVVPPSTRPDGKAYRFIEGNWEYLEAIPTIRPGSLPDPPLKTKLQAINDGASDEGALSDSGPGIGHNSGRFGDVGHRNDTLFNQLLDVAHQSTTGEDLLSKAHERNALFNPPLLDNEVQCVTANVWQMKLENRILKKGGRQRVGTYADRLEAFDGHGDAILLLMYLLKSHGGRHEPFCIVIPAMVSTNLIPKWTKHTYRDARDTLLRAGFIVCVHKGGRHKHDPSLYELCD